MGRVIVDVSPSIDGFLAGVGVSVERPFGDAGQRLHRWMGTDGGKPTPEDERAAKLMFENLGAVVIGRRMFDVGIDLWGADGAWGRPCFVVTNRPRADLVKGPTTFTFVDNVTRALDMAHGIAGPSKEVLVGGGASIVQQVLALGVVDELRLHVVPVLLGCGVRLFDRRGPRLEMEPAKTVPTPNALHQSYVRART